MTITEARGPRGRLVGLLGRDGLPPGHALLLRTRSVHTWGMRFALDLVWLDGAGDVVRVDHAVGPWRVRSCRAARAVVECAAGDAAAVRRLLSSGTTCGGSPTPGSSAP